MKLLIVGYNREVVAALCGPDAGHDVWVIEEPDLWRNKRLADHAAQYPTLRQVLLATYQQTTGYLEILDQLPPIDAVVPGLEYAVPAAADLAEHLGCRGATLSAATVLCDKLSLRDTTVRGGMRAPDFREVTTPQEVADFLARGPLVLKPARRQASLGVVRLEQDAEVTAAWAGTTEADEGPQLAERDLTWRYLVERTLVGSEYSTEALILDGEVIFVNVTSKETLPGPFPVELGHSVAHQVSEARWRNVVTDLVRVVGFDTGMIHAEWMDTDDGIVLIECAGRPPGDGIVGLIDQAWGFSLLDAWVDCLAGRRPDVPTSPHCAAATRFLTAPPGVLAQVHGVDEARAATGVLQVQITASPGMQVQEVRSSWDRIGSVTTTAANPDTAVAHGKAAAELIHCAMRGTS